MKVDFHCHILPDVDHGSKSIAQSLQMLRNAKENNIDCIVATPHFFSTNSTISEFISLRDKAFDKLNKAMPADEKLPTLVKAAEVYLTTDTPNLEGLKRLCIGDTSFILIEMPYEYWSQWVYDAIYKLTVKCGLTPIIAHIERYATTKADPKAIPHLLELDVYAQMNTYSVTDFITRSKALKLIKNNCIHLLGTDSHDDIRTRKDYAKASKIIRSRLGNEMLDYLNSNALSILRNQEPPKKISGDYPL